ncbi:zinc finger protein Noc-like [Pollicipes pollicipes]|uniref:zinc finger protein Noc-like n=1 Tax=Pollicipes pollicipes TaxID=41117 RepID=UPI0018857883|nr:zinc finger protein Noc-like [Pollicipes pollicipes]
MDAKTSPLAMLQRTCSQIGADTTAAKPLITAEKKREEKKETPSSPTAPAAEKPTFKPYDLDRKEPAPAPAATAAAAASTQQHRGEKCQSPYCPCAYSTPHGYGAPCPAGCAQCEHAKALGGALHSPYLGLVNPFYPPTSLGLGLSAAAGTTAGAQPIVCSWMADGRYCGKRFASTEELMQHLRTHTNLSASDSALSLLHPAYQASLLGAHRSPFAVPPSSLSPLSAARYHPYAKPPSSLALGAPHPSALAAYYSPYSALYARPPTLP